MWRIETIKYAHCARTWLLSAALPTRSCLPVLVVLLSLQVMVAMPVRAQISPGPLSSAHENLEGVTNCLKCHGVGKKQVDDKCLACHQEVQFLRSQNRGFHARGASGECRDCHPEHGGRDFKVVDWGSGGAKAFEHAQAGWRLDGKHAEVDCRGCHKPQNHDAAVHEKRPGGLSAASWMGLSSACAACHKDPHRNRFGQDCVTCHTTVNFTTVRDNSFDHNVTKYPLQGRHVQVACAKCHKDGYKELPKFAECRSCHKDPHAGEAKLAGQVTDCASCHTVAGFVPSTYDVAQHAEAAYPLVGRHRAATCRSCHRANDKPFRFRLQFAQCADCHEDAHAGQLRRRADGGQCVACHDVQGFAKSSFSVADHADLAFPLWGAHGTVACKACHTRPTAPDQQARFGAAGVPLHFESTACIACHVAPHGDHLGRADSDCLKCHNASGFSPSLVDPVMHNTFEYRLEGAHGAVPCLECHGELASARPRSTLLAAADGWPLLSFRVAQQDCCGCHKDPHAGQFNERDGGACASCHTLDAFRPAERFDHDRDARFALSGAHARVACRECHKVARLANGSEGLLYRPMAYRCEDCHTSGMPGVSP